MASKPQDIQIGIGFHRIADRVRNLAEGSIKRFNALVNHRCRVDVEGSSIVLRKFGYGGVIRNRGTGRAFAAKALASSLAEDKARRPPLQMRSEAFISASRKRPFTFMATTVWSSKVSTPEACSDAALNRESTTAIGRLCGTLPRSIFSARPRPNNSPLRLRGVQDAVAEKYKHVAGLGLETELIVFRSLKQTQWHPVASIISFLPSWQYIGRGSPELATCNVRFTSSQTA